eukprot:TRINITY_DN1372_c0_g1_i1.p1 TRINITY_DN1372_c0_g1~~TRINITY_DN1372_c0_g1_i1.p1  ORF type:complete len:1031 (-),score=350.05 TRINITY_DN1372_c0_g1_i1:10-3102(-)
MDEIMIAAKEVIGSSKVMSAALTLGNPQIFDLRMGKFRDSMANFVSMVVSAVFRYSLFDQFAWILQVHPWEESSSVSSAEWSEKDQSLGQNRVPTQLELSNKIMKAATAFGNTISDAFYSGVESNNEVVRISEVNLANFLKKIIVTCYEYVPKEEQKVIQSDSVKIPKTPVTLTNSLPTLPELSPRGSPNHPPRLEVHDKTHTMSLSTTEVDRIRSSLQQNQQNHSTPHPLTQPSMFLPPSSTSPNYSQPLPFASFSAASAAEVSERSSSSVSPSTSPSSSHNAIPVGDEDLMNTLASLNSLEEKNRRNRASTRSPTSSTDRLTRDSRQISSENLRESFLRRSRENLGESQENMRENMRGSKENLREVFLKSLRESKDSPTGSREEILTENSTATEESKQNEEGGIQIPEKRRKNAGLSQSYDSAETKKSLEEFTSSRKEEADNSKKPVSSQSFEPVSPNAGRSIRKVPSESKKSSKFFQGIQNLIRRTDGGENSDKGKGKAKSPTKEDTNTDTLRGKESSFKAEQILGEKIEKGEKIDLKPKLRAEEELVVEEKNEESEEKRQQREAGALKPLGQISSSEARNFWVELEKKAARDSIEKTEEKERTRTSVKLTKPTRTPVETSKFTDIIYTDVYPTYYDKSLMRSEGITKKNIADWNSIPLIITDLDTDWTIEPARPNADSHLKMGYPLVVPTFYREFYLNNFKESHSNFFIKDPKGSFIVSLKNLEKDDDKRRHEAILRSEKGDFHTHFATIADKKTDIRKEIIGVFGDVLKGVVEKSMFEVNATELRDELIKYEKAQICKAVKIGVLLCKPGQTTETEMFNNAESDKHFEDFLDLMGEKIELKGFDGFRGGLDVVRGTTGQYSRYSLFRGIEVMCHVSTYLPFVQDDEQQLERKRHLGNDIVMIVFKEGNTPISPTFMASHFTHILVVVQPLTPAELGMRTAPEEGTEVRSVAHYRVSVSNKKGMPTTQPFIHQSTVFHKDELREFLLLKVLNAEMASIWAPSFAGKLARTRKQLLDAIVESYSTNQ